MTSKPIIIVPDPGISSHADAIAHVRRERDILAKDVAATGGRLIAATVILKSIETSAFRALMFTENIGAETDMFDGCNASRRLLDQMTAELSDLQSIGFGGRFETLIEVSFGEEVIVTGDTGNKTPVFFPSMTPEGDGPPA
jgi:hypothetical protein